MKIKNILCPTDFSPMASKAVDRAGQLAKRHNAILHIVHIYEPIFTDPTGDGVIPADATGIQKQLKATKPSAEGVVCRHEFIYGLPAGAICGYARTNEIDLIVMGSQRHPKLSGLTHGSVSETVLRWADCAVMTVRNGGTGVDTTASATALATGGIESARESAS